MFDNEDFRTATGQVQLLLNLLAVAENMPEDAVVTRNYAYVSAAEAHFGPGVTPEKAALFAGMPDVRVLVSFTLRPVKDEDKKAGCSRTFTLPFAVPVETSDAVS